MMNDDYNSQRNSFAEFIETKSNATYKEGNPILFIIVGLLFFIIGVVMLNNSKEFIKNGKPIEATLYVETNTIGNSKYQVYADYSVDGEQYYEKLYGYDESGVLGIVNSENGKKETIYYNPDDPSKISLPAKNNLFSYVFMALGGLAAVAGIAAAVKKFTNGEKMNSSPTKDVYSSSQKERINNSLNDFKNGHGALNTYFNAAYIGEKVIYNLKRVVFIGVSIIIIIVGLFFIVADNSFASNAKQADATITRIESHEERDANNRRYIQTDTYVSYIVNDKEYEEILPGSGLNYKEGDSIKIYYDSVNPTSISLSNKKSYTGWIILAVGGVLFAIGLFSKGNVLNVSFMRR